MNRLWRGLHKPVDGASLAAFRFLFGLVLGVGALRFLAQGWVTVLFEQPRFFFKYDGFAWVHPLPHPWMHVVVSVEAVAAFLFAIGAWYRSSLLVFLLCFAYCQLVDLTNYLNHYYLVVLLTCLLFVTPGARVASVDAWRRRLRVRRACSEPPPSAAPRSMPAWCLWLFRFQFAVVYFYAGLAKLGEDWLLHGQPMGIWMASRTETWVIGPWLSLGWVALAMSWFGFLYDTSIAAFLLWRRTRPLAYVAVLVFHALTLVFFNIGLFPFLMSVGATLFFSPSWPRNAFRTCTRALHRVAALVGLKAVARKVYGARATGGPIGATPPPPARSESSWEAALAADSHRVSSHNPSASTEDTASTEGLDVSRGKVPPWTTRTVCALVLAAMYVTMQVVVPLRHYAMPGNVLWNEHGMRFSWKVLVRHKSASLTYLVSQRTKEKQQDAKVWQVSPHDFLAWRQVSEMSGQPDMIVALARHIAEDFRLKGRGEVDVHVRALVSLNGRRATPLFHEHVEVSRLDESRLYEVAVTKNPIGPPLSVLSRARDDVDGAARFARAQSRAPAWRHKKTKEEEVLR